MISEILSVPQGEIYGQSTANCRKRDLCEFHGKCFLLEFVPETRNVWYKIPEKTFSVKFTEVTFPEAEKARAKERKRDGVGVMKDKELKLEDVKAPHTLG